MDQLNKALEKARSNERLLVDDALAMIENGDLISLGNLADRNRRWRHPESTVTYVVDRNINYTNVCVSGCLFCAFYRKAGHPEAFVISKDLLGKKIEETLSFGGTQILLQGGMNPELDLEFYLDMLRFIKSNYNIHIHGFSPPEIAFIAQQADLSIRDTIRTLRQEGLDTIPGGGAEILVDRIRKKVSPNKCDTDTWLNVMAEAHRQGMRTTATMMFGHLESTSDIVDHLIKIRDLQDQTGGFTAFIPWTFQPKNTKIQVAPTTSAEYLKVLALSRLVLDNVDNIQASWVTQGAKIAQTALLFGANDLGSTMIEENVVAAAGVKFRLPKEEIVRIIEDAGFTSVQRNCYYDRLSVGDGPKT